MAWLVAEDDAAKKKIESLLADRDENLSLIKRTLQGKLSYYFSYSSHVLTDSPYRASRGSDRWGAWARRL